MTNSNSNVEAANSGTRLQSAGQPLAYYNFDKLMSFNGKYNFLVGGRGLGKTYGAKVKAIKAAIKSGDEFIYLRRYKDELKVTKPSFFDDISEEFPNHDFQIVGNQIQYAPRVTREEKKRTWYRIGWFIALSTAQNQKSVSYHRVKTIIFDEFIIEKGMIHYLPNESMAFTNFFNTVDRSKDKTRAFFLANSVSIENPYFQAYDIEPKGGDEWIQKYKLSTGRAWLVCHIAESKEYQAGVLKTEFGQFISASDPDYADYAVGNSFRDNHGNLLGEKTPEAIYSFSLETEVGTFSIWRDWKTMQWYIQAKRPKTEILFTICPNKMASGKKLLFTNDRQLQVLRAAFKSDKVCFDKPQTRQSFIKIFTR